MAPHAEDAQTTMASQPGVNETDSTTALPSPMMNTGSANMKAFLPPTFASPLEHRTYLKGRLALAFRIFAKHSFDEGVAGHITVRDPIDPSTFWLNPFGTAFALIKASDLIRVSEDGEVLEGGPNRLLNRAAFMIHSAVHKARPDVLAAAHAHSIYGRAFCTLGREVDMLTQDSCAFFDDHVVYKSYNGVVCAEDEGRDIAASLGGRKAALLQNHGLLTVGRSIEAAVFWFVSLERSCQAQLMAEAAAAGRAERPVMIGDEEARGTHEVVGSHLAGYFSARPMFDVMARDTGGEHLL